MMDGDTIEKQVLAELEAIGIHYERIEIDPEFADTAEFCEKYNFPLANSGNTIVVAAKKEPLQYAACVVRADTRLDVNHRVRQLMGVRRLSFAGAEQTAQLTGMQIGGVTVLALPEGLPIYIDARLMELEYVILGSGSRSSKLKLSPELFRRMPSVEIVADLGGAAALRRVMR